MNINDQRITHIQKTLAELRSTTDHTQQLIDDLSLTLDHLRSPGPPEPTDHRRVPRAGGPGMAPAPGPRPRPMPYPRPPVPPVPPNRQPPRPGPRPMQGPCLLYTSPSPRD